MTRADFIVRLKAGLAGMPAAGLASGTPAPTSPSDTPSLSAPEGAPAPRPTASPGE